MTGTWTWCASRTSTRGSWRTSRSPASSGTTDEASSRTRIRSAETTSLPGTPTPPGKVTKTSIAWRPILRLLLITKKNKSPSLQFSFLWILQTLTCRQMFCSQGIWIPILRLLWFDLLWVEQLTGCFNLKNWPCKLIFWQLCLILIWLCFCFNRFESF